MFHINSIGVSAKEHICREYIMNVLDSDYAHVGRGKEVSDAVLSVYPSILHSDETTARLLYGAALGSVSELPISEIVELVLKNEVLDALFAAIYNTEFVQNLINGAETLVVEVTMDENGTIRVLCKAKHKAKE